MTAITTIRDDITRLHVDVIVNAANSRLAGGGGVDGAIHAAGGPEILAECQAWVLAHGPLATGEAMITGAGELLADHVIHTVGPVYTQYDDDESARLLASCYLKSLDLAEATGCRSIAFPNISTGVFGYPKELAGRVAVESVRSWLTNMRSMEDIVFVSFDTENQRVYEELIGS